LRRILGDLHLNVLPFAPSNAAGCGAVRRPDRRRRRNIRAPLIDKIVEGARFTMKA
jgi:hypothetical protein